MAIETMCFHDINKVDFLYFYTFTPNMNIFYIVSKTLPNVRY